MGQQKIDQICRTCDGESCEEAIFPKGDGTTPFLPSEEGGKYFCSADCREKYRQADTSLLQLVTESFEKMGMPSPDVSARIFIEKLSPIFLEVTSADDLAASQYRFSSTIAPEASLISCVLTGDKSFMSHVGDTGIVHTPLRIGDFAHVVSTVAPASLLRAIEIVRFITPIPLGTTVIITATEVNQERNQRVPGRGDYKVVAHLEDGTAVSRPSIVQTFTPQ